MFNWFKLPVSYLIYYLCLRYFNLRVRPPIQGNGSGYHLQQSQITCTIQEMNDFFDWHPQPVTHQLTAMQLSKCIQYKS